MEKLVVPVIPVYLEPHSKEKCIELPFPSDSSPITGGQLKESIMRHQGTPKNRQIVVVFDSNFAIDKIVHDESRLSDSDMANVCVLECRLGIRVQVRWPKESDCEAAREETVTLKLSLDDKVSEIKRIIESMADIEIQDSMILINDLEIRDAEKSLSHYHVVSTSTLKLIIIKYSDIHATPQPIMNVNPLASASMPNFRRGSAQFPSAEATPHPKMNPLTSASTPNFNKGHSRAVETPPTTVYSQRQSLNRRSLPFLHAPSNLAPITTNRGTRPTLQYSNAKPLPAIGQKIRQDSEIGVEATDEGNEQYVVSSYAQRQSVHRPCTTPMNQLASASMPDYYGDLRSRGSMQTSSTKGISAYSQRQARGRPRTASLSSYDRKYTSSHTKLSPINSVFAPQKRKNRKERRKHNSEGSYPQTSTEDETAFTIPINLRMSLPASMFSNQQRAFSDLPEEYTSGDTSGGATESDEEYDQHASIYEDETPLAGDFDWISTRSSESLKDERLELRVLITELHQVRVKWFHLGLQLQIEYDTLQSIKEQHANNMDDCLCGMLHYWLKQPKLQPTWKTVIKALKCGPVNEGQLAMETTVR